MRILATGDLHYNITRSQAPTEALARRLADSDADVLVVLGDVGGRRLEHLANALSLFDDFRGHKLFVAGNHDLWTWPAGDSLKRYETEIAGACAELGWHYLDVEPAVIEGVGFVGNIGWYDHSFRPATLGIPLRFYQAKVAPGAAARMSEHRPLVEGFDDIPDAALEITTRWMDGVHVRLPFDDETFTQQLAEKLERHLADVATRADRILVGMHHLPFEEMVVRTGTPGWDFASNYLGSEAFGRVILAEPKATHVLCAHNHRSKEIRRGRLQCISVGSTYTDKHLLELTV